MSWRDQSYQVLPALSVRRRQLRSSMRIVTAGFALAMVWMTCASGSHMKIYARMLGFTDLHFGLMSSLPYLASFAQLFAAILIERTGLRKYQFIESAVSHRMIWLLIALIPLILPIPSTAAVVVMLALLCLSSFLASLAEPAWLTWMGDLIPRRIRGRYWAVRNRIGEGVRILAVLVVGVVIDALIRPGAPETRQAQPVLLGAICVILAVGAIAGVIDILLFRSVREIIPGDRPAPPPVFAAPPAPRGGLLGRLLYPAVYLRSLLRQMLAEPLRDRVFRHYVGFGATLTLSTTVGSWYYWIYCMEDLGFGKLGANFLFLVVPPISGILASRMWGRLVDRWGRRPVLVLATIGTTLSIVPWFLVTPDTPAPRALVGAMNWLASRAGALFGRADLVWIAPDSSLGAYLMLMLASVIGGFCWTGVSLAQMGVVLGFSDGHGRSRYVAGASLLISMGGMLGGLAGGFVAYGLGWLRDNPLHLGPLVWNNYHATFALTVLVRLASLLWLVHMPDPGAVAVREVVGRIGANVYNAVIPRLFYPLRVFGWGRRGGRLRRRRIRFGSRPSAEARPPAAGPAPPEGRPPDRPRGGDERDWSDPRPG